MFRAIFIILAVLCFCAGAWIIYKSRGRATGAGGALLTADEKRNRFAWGLIVIVIGAFFVVGAIIANAFTGETDDSKGGSSEPQATSTAKLGSDGDEDKDSIDLNEAAMPEVNLTQAELDKMFGDYDRYLLHGSMPESTQLKIFLTSVTKKGKINQKQAFSGSVTTPLWADTDEIEEGLGYVRRDSTSDNPLTVGSLNVDPKGTMGKNLQEALKKQAAVWMREFLKDIENAETADEAQRIMRTRLYNQILRNPVYGDMFVQWLANEPLATKNNPWLTDFKELLDDAYVSDKGITSFVQFDPNHLGDDKYSWVKLTDEYWYNAGKVCVLLDNFIGVGLKDGLKSKKNWWLPMQADANHMRTELAKAQEKREVFVLEYRDKSGRVLLKIGVNFWDMRLEVFPVKVKIKTPEKTPAPVVTPRPTDPPSVTPPPPSTPKGKLVVHYKYKNGPQKGKTAAKDRSATKYVGQIAEISSPTIKGYTADKAVVSAKIKKGTIYRTVWYSKNGKTPKYNLTIKYVFADGSGSAAPTYSKAGLKAGTKYSVKSPAVAEHKPDKAVVSGTMPSHDVTITVKYSKKPKDTPTPSPKPTPKPSKKPPKDPKEDPVQNSKAPTGGGDNKPGNGDGDHQPVKPSAKPQMTSKPTKKPVESNDENGTTHGGNPPSTGNITNGGKDDTVNGGQGSVGNETNNDALDDDF